MWPFCRKKTFSPWKSTLLSIICFQLFRFQDGSMSDTIWKSINANRYLGSKKEKKKLFDRNYPTLGKKFEVHFGNVKALIFFALNLSNDLRRFWFSPAKPRVNICNLFSIFIIHLIDTKTMPYYVCKSWIRITISLWKNSTTQITSQCWNLANLLSRILEKNYVKQPFD